VATLTQRSSYKVAEHADGGPTPEVSVLRKPVVQLFLAHLSSACELPTDFKSVGARLAAQLAEYVQHNRDNEYLAVGICQYGRQRSDARTVVGSVASTTDNAVSARGAEASNGDRHQR